MATQEGQVWKCEICGMVVKVEEAGAGSLVCCGQEMTKIKDK